MSPTRLRLGPDFLLTGASELFRPEPRIGGAAARTRGEVVWVRGGRIAFTGPRADLPSEATAAAVYDVGNRAVLPGLVDCHTHIVFGGDRVEDFALRAAGVGYAEIAAAGGGIRTTVAATRASSTDSLVARARHFLERRAEQGVLTTEVKSGYGLDETTELRMLEVIQRLRDEGWDVEATLLAAHALPSDRPREAWLDAIETHLIPEVAGRGLARFVDVFVEREAYTVDEARRVFAAARTHRLIPRVHADQLSPGGGAELAAEVEAASADHLEHVSEAGMAAMAARGVVAVLLPGAMLHLGDRSPGLGRRMAEAGVEVAVATDANPGSSPTHNLGLMATVAVTQLGCSVEQVLRACTYGAALALRRPDIGHLEPGAQARFVVLDHPDSRAWVGAYGEPVVAEVVTS